MWWPWRRRRSVDRQTALSARPLRNPLLEWEQDGEGLVTIRVPRKDARWVKALGQAFYIPKARTFSLDEPGTFVWGLCDGTKEVRAIIQSFAQQFKLTRKEAEVSTLQYFKLLTQKGFVGLAVEGARRGPEHVREGT